MKKKSLLTIGSIYLVAGLVAACASTSDESKNETPAADTTAASATKAKVPSVGEVRDKYSISQLDAAATAMKVISSVGVDPKQDGGSEIIGCPVTVGQARVMQASLKYLVEGRVTGERDVYSADPPGYGDSNSFESCGSSCSCGVLSSIVRGARTDGFKANDLKYHERWVARLKLKASAIGEREEKVCAMKQSWICGSDLMAYLQAQPGI